MKEHMGHCLMSKYLLIFFKTENSAPGLGLGLAIVQSICRHEQFKIEYSFEAKHKFTVTGTK